MSLIYGIRGNSAIPVDLRPAYRAKNAEMATDGLMDSDFHRDRNLEVVVFFIYIFLILIINFIYSQG